MHGHTLQGFLSSCQLFCQRLALSTRSLCLRHCLGVLLSSLFGSLLAAVKACLGCLELGLGCLGALLLLRPKVGNVSRQLLQSHMLMSSIHICWQCP